MAANFAFRTKVAEIWRGEGKCTRRDADW